MIRELVVVSGKGGTGKTSLLAAFAALTDSKVLSDADVDASDLHLLTAPKIRERHDFQAGHRAVIDPVRCTRCGLCQELCRWEAIGEDFQVKPLDCEGCGVCVYFCPEKAIDFPIRTCGEWFLSETRFGPMVHARLGIAQENSGKLVTLVRNQARKTAEDRGLSIILTDGPPGVGCPVIASIGGATVVLIVTEPTVSGRHDMERVAQLAAHFQVPGLLCVNKCDINPEETMRLWSSAKDMRLVPVGEIPFDPIFTRAMVQGKTVIEYDAASPAATSLRAIWANLQPHLYR